MYFLFVSNKENLEILIILTIVCSFIVHGHAFAFPGDSLSHLCVCWIFTNAVFHKNASAIHSNLITHRHSP